MEITKSDWAHLSDDRIYSIYTEQENRNIPMFSFQFINK